MAHYKNDYTKEEDVMLWQLHEIRHQLAEQDRSPDDINRHAQEILALYPHLTHLKIVWNIEHVVAEQTVQQQTFATTQ